MTRIFDEVEDWFHHREHHQPYNDPETPPAPEAPMSLATIEADIRNGITDVVTHAEELVAKAKTVVEEHLPGLAEAAQKAEASPIVQALEGAFLPAEDEAMIATLIGKLASYAAEHEAQVPAEPAAPAEPDVPGDPGEPVPVPAGPVVGGQAQ